MPGTAGGYDLGYSRCPCFWGRGPGSLVELLLARLPTMHGWSVLDAGCGEGKNAVYLAERGATVRAIDVSPLAIHNARHAWAATDSISWEVADIAEVSLSTAAYDLVIAYGLLHCLNSSSAIQSVVNKLQLSTRPGGHNIVCALNARHQDLSDAHPDLRPTQMRHEEYLAFYADWFILRATDSDLTVVHPHNNIEHCHSLTRVLARRRNDDSSAG